MGDYIRGATIEIRSTPKDLDGNPVAVATAKVLLNYIHADGTRSTDDPLDMTQDGDDYIVEFDSKVCLPGFLYCSIRTTDPAAADDITHRIFANPANPDPE